MILIWYDVKSCNTNSILTTQNVKFSIKDFFSQCDQIRRKLRIWSHLLKKSLVENLILAYDSNYDSTKTSL